MTHISGHESDLGPGRLPRRPEDRAAIVLAALGGRPNVLEIEACITRLRVEVRDGSLVDDAGLRAAGAHDVLRSGTRVQAVFGPESDAVAADLEALL